MSKTHEIPTTTITSSSPADAATVSAQKGSIQGGQQWTEPLSFVVQEVGVGALILFTAGLLLDLLPFQLTTLIVSLGVAWGSMGLAALLKRHQVTGEIMATEQGSVRRWRRLSRYGAWGLVLITGMWCLLEIAAAREWVATSWVDDWRSLLVWLCTAFGVLVVLWQPLLLIQQQGHALWRNPLWPAHCVVQALYGGSGLFLLLDGVLGAWGTERLVLANGLGTIAETAFGLLLFVNLLLTVGSAIGFLRETEEARASVQRMTSGPFRDIFWWGGIGLGHAVPLGLLMLDHALIAGQAPLYAWIGLFCFTYAYLLAPQRVTLDPETVQTHEQ